MKTDPSRVDGDTPAARGQDLSRRTVLGGLAALVGVGLTADAAAPRRYGPVTLDRWRVLKHQGVYLHVIHQGVDITHQCFFADDTGEGVALLRLRHGRPWEPTSKTVHGVTFQAEAV